MGKDEQLKKLDRIIERLPQGRMLSEYIRQRNEAIERKKEEEWLVEKIGVLVDIGKQMKVQCFMCRAIMQKYDMGQELTAGDKYHIQADIPALVKVKSFQGKVLVSIEYFINKLNA